MNIKDYYFDPSSRPLDRLLPDGGFCGIFRTIGCIGDSLSSGEFESMDAAGNRGYHDYFEYSWGQYIARMTGAKVYNFSRGGMTASEYCNSFAEANGFWDEKLLCQAYIIALGVNDVLNQNQPLGTTGDICPEDHTKNAPTFAGYYGKIISRLKSMQPKARFFLVTMPRGTDEARNRKAAEVTKLLYEIADLFEWTYVIDLEKEAPVYDAEFYRNFFLGGHLNPAGYLLTAKMIATYIDYYVRKYPEDFTQVGFIGTPFHNAGAKW
ncbi:MAG: SGNH/GDSL hydrolase family protein [Lachnospiraceae bacterium]|nr:SGNH/GDSL hydrolase family protein [Lachnospiraceae bacterium]